MLTHFTVQRKEIYIVIAARVKTKAGRFLQKKKKLDPGAYVDLVQLGLLPGFGGEWKSRSSSFAR